MKVDYSHDVTRTEIPKAV